MTQTISPVFKRMLSASQIEDTVRDSLKTWFPTYLREEERQLGLPTGTFPAPENYTDRNSFDAEAGEKLPKIVVIAPGTIGNPVKRGSGTYSASWRLGIGIAIGAKTEDRANMEVKSYAAAIRGILLQNSGLGDIGAVDITWTDEQYEDVPVAVANQLVKAASLYFNVDMNDVIFKGPGPQVPNESSYVYGEVEDVEILLEKE